MTDDDDTEVKKAQMTRKGHKPPTLAMMTVIFVKSFPVPATIISLVPSFRLHFQCKHNKSNLFVNQQSSAKLT